MKLSLTATPIGRTREWIEGRFLRGKVLFTSPRRRATSVAVRGDQIAAEIGGACLRARFLSDACVASSPALFWINRTDLDLVRRFDKLTAQFLDVVIPSHPDGEAAFAQECRSFRYFLVNTESSKRYLGLQPGDGRRAWIMPHHHCNFSGWFLPEERIAEPKVVGYIGEAVHLHDFDAIKSAVEGMGMRLLCADSWRLDDYRRMDIGIAWTRPDGHRDESRSNIKLTNFAGHGIPAVVCDYESYRRIDEETGGVASIRGSLASFIEALRELVGDEALRRHYAENGRRTSPDYSCSAIARRYLQVIEEAGHRS